MKKLIVAFIAGLLVFAGCKTSQSQQKESSAVVGADENSVEVKINKTFELSFKTNASTGFAWYWANGNTVAIVDSVGERYVLDQPELTGSGSTRYWQFKAVKPGIDTLKFKYARIWSGETIRTRDVIVKVKK